VLVRHEIPSSLPRLVVLVLLAAAAVCGKPPSEASVLVPEEMAVLWIGGSLYRACNAEYPLGCSAECAREPASGKWKKTVGNSIFRCGDTTEPQIVNCEDWKFVFCGLELTFDNEQDCHDGQNWHLPTCVYVLGCKDTYNPWGCPWGGPGQ